MFGDGEKPVFKGKSENCMVQKVRLFDGIFKAWGVSGRLKIIQKIQDIDIQAEKY